MGTNQITYGSQGSGIRQFYGAYGLALDSKGRIYVSDTYNCRIVRIDDMNGTNWTTYGGTCGSGEGQFADPQGMAIDSNDRIYVMDTGNSRLVRIDDMMGSNWTVFNNASLVSTYTNVAVDSNGRIYIADSGNNRIVRMDDMNGTNWISLSQSQNINGYIYPLQNPVGVAVYGGSRIYIADDESYQPNVIRIDNMNGDNWVSFGLGLGQGTLPFNSITLDASGAVFLGGYGVRVVNGMYGLLQSSGDVGPYGTYYIFGTTPVPTSHPLLSAVSLKPTTLSFTENVGTRGNTQTVAVFNFGSSLINLAGISTSGPFTQTNNCPASLAGGSTCTVSVSFAPTVAGISSGSLVFIDDSGNQGSSKAAANRLL